MITKVCNVRTTTDATAERIEQRTSNTDAMRQYIKLCKFEVVGTTYAGNKLYKVVSKSDKFKRNILLGYRRRDNNPLYASNYKVCSAVCDALNYGALVGTQNWSFAQKEDFENMPILERMKPILKARASVARSLYSGMRSKMYLATGTEQIIHAILQDVSKKIK